MEVDKSELVKVLNVVKRVAPTRASNPIMTQVRLTGTNDDLTLTAFNGEVFYRGVVPASVGAIFDTLVPAHKLIELVSNLKSDSIFIELENNEMLFAAGRQLAKLTTMQASDYPEFVFEPYEQGAQIKAKDLHDGLDSVAYCCATDDFRGIFRGVLLKTHDGLIVFAASDGYRFAEKKMAYDSHIPSVVIPKRNLAFITTVLNLCGPENMAAAGYAHGRFTVSGKNHTIQVATLDGNDFPNYEKIISQDSNVILRFDRRALMDAFKMMGIFAAGDTRPTRIEVSGKTMVLTSRGDYGESSDVVILEDEVEKPFSFHISAAYMQDALNQVSAEGLQWALTVEGETAKKPTLLTDSAGNLAVVVPLVV